MPYIAFLAVGGFLVLTTIIILLIFLSRKRRVANAPDGDENGFQNEGYEVEEFDNNFFSQPRSAVNMLYMTQEQCQQSLAMENDTQPLSKESEC